MSDEILSRAAAPEEYAQLAKALPSEALEDDPLYGAFGRRYYPAVHGDRVEDRSFAVVARDGAVFLVECDLLDGVLGRYGMPLRILRGGRSSEKAELRVLRVVLEELQRVAQEAHASRITVADDAAARILGSVGRACLAAEGRASIALHACVDLTAPVEALRSSIRKSYRSLVNWGERSLSMEYCNASYPDRELFHRYEELHERVAGRRTRPQESWDVMFEFVATGHGELSLASFDDELVAGSLVIDGTTIVQYASAAYVREKFDHPLAHWPVFNAILRAKTRNLRWFDIGEIRHRADVGDKEASIGFFKRGFTDRIDARVRWSLPIDGAKS